MRMDGRRRMPRILLPLVLLGLTAFPAVAQTPTTTLPLSDSTLIDRVMAVVGDSVILRSEVEQELSLARQEGVTITEREVLENLVDLQMILQAAAKDGTTIPPDAEVTRRIDAQIETVRARFADENQFQQALAQGGLTVTSYREQLRARFRSDLTREVFRQRYAQTAPAVVVSEAEMRAFFDENRSQLQQRPPQLTVQQVLIRSGASDAAWERSQQFADSLRLLLSQGADFETLAREHSQDPGSAARGGDLDWVQRGVMVPEFDRVVFSSPDGTLSAPVRTDFGYHLILVERSRPGEKRVRHILIRPEVEQADIDRARDLAEGLAARIRAGESALTLGQEFGDAEIPRELTVVRGREEEQLPPVYIQALADVREGAVVGPFQTEQILPPHTHMVVLHVTGLREAGDYTYEDVREQLIRPALTQQKREEQMLQELRQRTYVERRF